MFFVVDANDQPLPPLPRKLVHGHNVWHRSVHVWIVNNQGQILCQKRALDKESHPGFWESFFGGHVQAGESYQQAAVREIQEEIGITLDPAQFTLWRINKRQGLPSGHNHEFQAIYITKWNGKLAKLSFNDGEVDQAAWVNIAEVKRQIEQNGEKTWVEIGYELELLNNWPKKLVV